MCAAGATVPGYDVSHYQPDMSLHARMKLRGDKFCIIKADEGSHVVDHLFHAHWTEAKKQGMLTGAYNFFHPSQDPIAQAKHFESMVGKLGAGDLGPVIDWETADGVPAFQDREEGFKFLSDVENACGKTPIVYGGPYFLRDLALDSRFLRFALWVAHYKVKCPLLPPPWPLWSFWQFSDDGGIDLDVFNGSIDQLNKMAGM